MGKYLLKTVETYYVDLESEAKDLIESAKKDGSYDLSKYTSEYKPEKTNKKGDITQDPHFKVTLTKSFQTEKEPQFIIDVDYSYTNDFPTVTPKEEEEYSEDETESAF